MEAETIQTIANSTVQDFLAALGSDASAPGGGAAAGLSGALGAALGRMVAELTHTREKYAAFADGAKAASSALLPLAERMLSLADADALAYAGYMDALALPKATENEKTVRRVAMQAAILRATEVPCGVIDTCLLILRQLEALIDRSNPTCAGDLAAAAAELTAAAKIAWLNVLANLPYWKDKEAAKAVRAEVQTKLDTLYTRCDALYSHIEASLDV